MAYLDYFEHFDFCSAVVYQISFSAYQEFFVVDREDDTRFEHVTKAVSSACFCKMRSGELHVT